MRSKTHIEQIERWAEFVRKNPSWKEEHTKFINAQIKNSWKIHEKILKMPNGKSKIEELKKLRKSR